MPKAELARRDGVELIRTGTWGASTGSWTPTKKDILAAVEAMKCPAVGKPILTIGHIDKRFTPRTGNDGEPGIGWVDNLRAGEDGDLLLGDYVGVPAWIDQIMASAWPKRSIEGRYNYRCALNHRHEFALDAVSLLGTTSPAIPTLRSLNDVAELYGVDIAAGAGDENQTGEHVYAVVAAAEVHTSAMIALVPAVKDAERLALDGGEPAGELHLTLAYLGEAAELGPGGRQDVIDQVSTVVNGLPWISADIFAVTCFNPTADEPCLVWGVTGEVLDAVHDLVDETLHLVDAPIPMQLRPWAAHITAAYSGDLARLSDLTAGIGPVTFDRIRLAFAGEFVDIPLMPWPGEDGTETDALPVAASAAVDIRARVDALRAARMKEAPVAAASDPNTPAPVAAPVPVEPLVPELPAAEPEPTTPDPKEDLVSTDLSAVRSRLGLTDDADEQAILSALDALKAKADTPPAIAEPNPELVAASAAAAEKATKAEQAQELMKEELTKVRDELNTIKASASSQVKASFFKALGANGQLKPAERETWEARYDRDPEMVTEILGGRPAGSEVPVMASGVTGPAEPVVSDDDLDREFAGLFSRNVSKEA